MKKSKSLIFLLLCGIVFGLAAFPVFAQDNAPKKVGEINKKLFQDLGDSINEKLAKNEVDLNKPFLVVLDGTLTEDGKFDRNTSLFVKAEGDEQMIIVVKDAIEAIGDSGLLANLKNYGGDKINLTLKQDDTQIQIILVSEHKDENKANTTGSSLKSIFKMLILADENNIKKLDDDSRLLINNTKITSEGKNFILNITLPKADAQAILLKGLKQRAETKAKQLDNQ